MKKNLIFYFAFIFLLVANTFAVEFSFNVIEDVEAPDDYSEPNYIHVPENTKVIVNTKETIFMYRNGQYYIDAYYNGNSYFFPDESIVLDGVDYAVPDEFKKNKWVMIYYYEMLREMNLKILTNHESYWHPEQEYIMLENDRYPWFYFFRPLYIELCNSFLTGSSISYLYSPDYIYIPESYENNILKVTIPTFDYDDLEPKQPQWNKMTEGGAPATLFFKLDGDFLYVYRDKVSESNLLYELARADDNTITQIENFVKTGTYDSSKVRFPKHENKDIKNTTSVSVNKTMAVKENLKLRSGEATTTNVLTVMKAGAKVKILRLGKSETIDGISGNWVQVEVLSGKDRDGKTLEKGTTGWCYGGYLEETQKDFHVSPSVIKSCINRDGESFFNTGVKEGRRCNIFERSC